MSINISLDRLHMAEIKRLYTECAAELDSAQLELLQIQDIYQTEYAGHATDIAPDAASKMREHVQLLRECCERLAEYVRYCDSEMAKADRHGSVSID